MRLTSMGRLTEVPYICKNHIGMLQCIAVCCGVLRCVAVCCNVLQYAAVCCSVLQCVAVCRKYMGWHRLVGSLKCPIFVVFV